MANELIYTANVNEAGELKIINRKGFDQDMQAFAGQRLILRIKKYRRSRSNKQNRFYFGNFMQSQIDCFKERWGYSYNKDQVHDWNKNNFWAEDHVDEDTGEVIKLPTSSTDYSTVEWEEKLDVIRTWFQEKFDWPLPFPEQQADLEF